MLPIKDTPGPVKLAWLVFVILALVVNGVMVWGFVEVVSWLTSK